MELVLILAFLLCFTGIVLGLVFPRLRPLAVVAGAFSIFVVAFFAWFVPLYLGVVDVDDGLAAAGVRPGSPLFGAVLLAPPALTTVAFVGLFVLWMRGSGR